MLCNLTLQRYCFKRFLELVINNLLPSACSMVVTGFKRPLTRDDLWSLMPDDKSSYVVPRFLHEWTKERNKAK